MKQTLKYIYSVIYENLKFAEAKHNIVITLSGAVIAFATTFFSNNSTQNVFAIASIIFALISILYSFVALVSRNVKIKQRKSKELNNLLFYKDLMKYDHKGLIDELRKEYDFTKIYKPDSMDYDLARIIIASSRLCYIKFIYFNFAVLFLIASIISIILTVLVRGGVLW